MIFQVTGSYISKIEIKESAQPIEFRQERRNYPVNINEARKSGDFNAAKSWGYS